MNIDGIIIMLLSERSHSPRKGASPRPGLAGDESEGIKTDAPQSAVGGAGARSRFRSCDHPRMRQDNHKELVIPGEGYSVSRDGVVSVLCSLCSLLLVTVIYIFFNKN